jgi:hypothetical protein
MGTAEGKKARSDARELAATKPADPYRGALTDPYASQSPAGSPPVSRAGAILPTGGRDGAAAGSGLRAPGTVADPRPPGYSNPSRTVPGRRIPDYGVPGYGVPGYGVPGYSVPGYTVLPATHRTPVPAVIAGVLAFGLAALLDMFGLLLLAIISLQDEYGAPDRSFYRGSDSSYLLLALLNFALGASLAIGGISLLTGRLIGRLVITVAGWTVLTVCGFWWLQSAVNGVVPLVMAAASLGMLAMAYQAGVTRWLGVLPAAQPE